MGGFRIKKFFFCFVTLFLTFSGFAFAESSSEALLLHEKGKLEFSAGRYDEALKFFREARATLPDHPQNLHLLGLTHLKLENFSEAEEALSKLLSKNPDYTPAYFDYGMSLYRQDKFELALPWFEKEEGALSLFYAGLSHYNLGHLEEATGLLKKVESLFPGTKTAESAREWIAKIEASEGEEIKPAKAPKRWSLKTTAGVFYDSNVIRDPDGENLAGFTNIADTAATGALDIKYLLVPKDRTKFYISYSGYQSAYLNFRFDSDDFNYGRHHGGFDLVHRVNDNFQWRVPLYYTYATLGRAKFVQIGEGGTGFDMVWNKNFLTSITGTAERDDFFGVPSNDADRDAIKVQTRIEQYYFPPNYKDFYFKLGYGFEKNLAAGNDWDYDSHHIYGAVQSPLFWKIKFLLLAEAVPRRTFANIDSNLGGRREDRAGIFNAVLSKDIFPFLTAQASYVFTIQKSRLTRFTYKRHVAGLTLSAKW